jgi:hypothetical protein
VTRSKSKEPDLIRVNPTRGHIAFGEAVLRDDLTRTDCHERLLQFSQRRTRRRSTILFFIAVCEPDKDDVLALLEKLDIRNGTRGGHVHVVPFDLQTKRPASRPRATKRRGRSQLQAV